MIQISFNNTNYTTATRRHNRNERPRTNMDEIKPSYQQGVIYDKNFLKTINAKNTIGFSGLTDNKYELAYNEKELTSLVNQSQLIMLNPIKEYQQLSSGDKKALKHLIKAAVILNDVFLKQDHPLNLDIKEELKARSKTGDRNSRRTKTMFNIFNGVEGQSKFDQEKIRLIKNIEYPEGKNLFPTGYSAEMLINYLTENPEQIPAILSNDTVVKAGNDRLYAVPYSVEYREEFEIAAKELLKASKETTHEGFRNYLRLQAQALVSNDPEYSFNADKAWAAINDCPLEFTITRESYDDEMTGKICQNENFNKLVQDLGLKIKSKDFIGARVGIVDLETSKDQSEDHDILKIIADEMPLKEQYNQTANTENENKQTLSYVDLVYLSGDNAALRPYFNTAQNLPNDDKLSAQLNAGSKNVFHKQLINLNNTKPHLEELLDNSQLGLYSLKADNLFVKGHELCHSFGPKTTRTGGDTKASLGKYGNIIEESKADMGSIMSVDIFVKHGKYSQKTAKEIYTTWAVKQLVYSNPPLDQAHRVRNVMQINYFTEKGAIEFNNGKIKIIPEKFNQTAKEMLTELIQIQLDGDAEKAKLFVEKYRQWNENLERASKILGENSSPQYKILHFSLAYRILNDEIIE